MPPAIYRGRFAPSPTGPLHHGSLLAAVASYLDAKAHQGEWLVRIEDIDPLREAPHAASEILETLDAHGLHWDGRVIYQSQRQARYQEVLTSLTNMGATYACPCSRAQLEAQSGRHSQACGYYASTRPTPPFAYRFRVPSILGNFKDCFQGEVPFDLESGKDDFVLQRKEGFYAYQLAVVVDDQDQGITHVIRGIDLLHSTPLQMLLVKALNYNPPEYGHFLLLTDAKGRKLSKQTHAPPVSNRHPMKTLQHVLFALGIDRQDINQATTLQDLLTVGIQGWKRHRLSSRTAIEATVFFQAASEG